MAQIFLNLKKERDITVRETQRVPNKMNSNILTPYKSQLKWQKLKTKFRRQQEKSKES